MISEKFICHWVNGPNVKCHIDPFYMTFGIWPIDPLAFGLQPVARTPGHRNYCTMPCLNA